MNAFYFQLYFFSNKRVLRPCSARVCSRTVDYAETISLQPLPCQVSAHPPRNGTMDSSFCFLMTGGSAVVTEATGEVTTPFGGNPSHHLSMHSVVWLSYWNYRVKRFPGAKTYPGFSTKSTSRENEMKWAGGVGDAAGMSGNPEAWHRGV